MTKSYRHLEVAVALPMVRTYTYKVREEIAGDLVPGKRVLVPFGKSKATGYFLGFTKPSGKIKAKQILDILDEVPLFPEAMIPLFRWVADYYIHPIGEVIKTALPGGINIRDFTVLRRTEAGRAALFEGSCTPLEKEILGSLPEDKPVPLKSVERELSRGITNTLVTRMEKSGFIVAEKELKGGATLKTERCVAVKDPKAPYEELSAARKTIFNLARATGEVSLKRLKEVVPSAPSIIKAMEASGHLTIFEKHVPRDPLGESIEPDTPKVLTPEQEAAVSRVTASLGNGFTSFLLNGVTGSGKTEVYMQIGAAALEKGMSVIVLVPEIALISQTERRFRARFGECIAVLHSALSKGERYDQWLRIAKGEVNIVIGARSAIFAPLVKPGIIIVDEEHDSSYKQDSTLRYNARDLAVVRAKFLDGCALLGSATPSLQSYHNVVTGKFTEVVLRERVNRQPLPEVQLVDLRKKKDARGNGRFITPELLSALTETLARGEQALLFLNRRGFSSFPVCGECGEAVKCRHCDISMTLHKSANAYRCHLCGFMASSRIPCPACGATDIQLLGMGTEKVEEAIREMLPAAKVARLDHDTTTKKGSILKILKGLKTKETDILVGTQMVAKGHDFPNVTLVGIICADLSLSFPDFRAGEQTFQILAQVAGRAGRGERPGRVIMQTYNPDHFSITAAKNQDFMDFFQKESAFRRELDYPPYSRIIQLRISGKDKRATANHAISIGDLCRSLIGESPEFRRSVEILGPIEASTHRIANRFRWQLLMKSPSSAVLRKFAKKLLFSREFPAARKDVRSIVDVDPFYMM